MVHAYQQFQNSQVRYGELRSYVDKVAMAITRQVANDLMAPYNLAPLEYSLLKFCMEQGECTATQIAGVLPVDASYISRLVNGLVERDLLRRQRPRQNRRIVILSLTEDAEDLISRVMESERIFDAMITDGISEEEKEVFVSVVTRILANCAARDESRLP